MSAACRSFEQRLAESLDRAPDGAAGRAARTLVAQDAHAASCAPCALLASLVAGHAEVFAFIARPAPADDFLQRLSRTPLGALARQKTAEVLAFLTPGALSHPEPSPALLDRLRAVSNPRAAVPSNVRRGVFGRLKPLATDWRFAVAAAYAATFVIVALLRIDPMSAARGAANDLTSAGERALSEARVAAVHRFDDSAIGRAAAPITKRLDYRIYRAYAAGRARAVAYSQLVYEKVFAGTVESLAVSAKDTKASTGPKAGKDPEPSGSFRRS